MRIRFSALSVPAAPLCRRLVNSIGILGTVRGSVAGSLFSGQRGQRQHAPARLVVLSVLPEENHSFFSVGKRVIIKKYIRFERLNRWIFTDISQAIEKSR